MNLFTLGPCTNVRRLSRVRRGRSFLRVVLITGTIAVLVVGVLAYRVATQVTELEVPETGVPPLINGTFLGMTLLDISHNQAANNPWLRLAMNAAHRGATPSRRFQMNDILVKDGQHPDTGEPAILVMMTPKFQEVPDPPFEPVPVRLWKPTDNIYYSQEKISELQKVRPPNETDLRRLEEVWSGNRVAEVASLVDSLRWLLSFTLLGVGLILAAGAYRSCQWLANKWDVSLVEQQKSRKALHQLREIRRSQDDSLASGRRE